MEGPVRTASLAEVRGNVGKEVGVSEWFTIDQSTIDKFADLTHDHYYIHVDPVRAKATTPFGGSIAHGFLTMSLMAAMAYQAVPRIAEAKMGVNYGFNRLRFMAPVPAGSRVRGRFTLKNVDDKGGGKLEVTHEVSVEIEGQPKPAIVAEWLGMTFV